MGLGHFDEPPFLTTFAFTKPKKVEDIILHIRYLLRQHSCVIMPRLGALIATERHACINEEWGRIEAPTREVCFNGAIVNNDGLLATSIARRLRISYEEACALMDKGIDRMKQHLEADGEVSLGRIGTLRRSDDGRLIFDPALTAQQQSDAMGLRTVAIPGHESDKAEAQATPVADKRYYHLRISKYATRVAAGIILPLVTAFGILIWTLSLNGNGTMTTGIDYASVLPMPSAKAPAAKEATETKAVSNAQEGVLVVAVFNVESQAQMFLNQHADSQYRLSISPYGKTYRVTTQPTGRENLLKLLHTTDFIVEYPGAWIWMLNK